METNKSGPPQKQSPPQLPIQGKPWAREFPTPNPDDYIVSVRADTRTSGFRMPAKGDEFAGVDQGGKLSSVFMFAKAVPVENLPDFVDLYYLAPFEEQEKYAFTVTFPYVDPSYPLYTYTYFATRTDDLVTQEAQADAPDPAGLGLMLTDHKIERIEDKPVLDAVFVRVTRIFERLPGPVIVSFGNNEAQQLVTVQAQEVAKGAPPAQSSVTEKISQERTGTAKAKNTLETVPVLFPATDLAKKRDYPIPAEFQPAIPLKTTAQVVEGSGAHAAVMPTLGVGDSEASQVQQTLFKKKVQTSHYDTVDAEADDQQMTEQQQVESIEKTIHKGPQDITASLSALTSSAEVADIGDGDTIMKIGTVPIVFPATDLSKRRDYPIPAAFQPVIPLKTTAQIVAGSAVMPTLGVGDSEAAQVQQTTFKKKISTSHYDTVDAEVDDQRMTEQQQVETVAETIHKGEQDITPSLSALTTSAEVAHIGDGDTVMKIGTVPEVFPATSLTTEIPSMTRELWLGGFDEQVFTQIQAGQATQPVITSGNYSITDKNLTMFKHEVTIHSLPPQVRNHREWSEEYGGGILDETVSIFPSNTLPIPTADEGYLITESKVRNLAAFGFIKVTKSLDPAEGTMWPPLHSEHVETDGIYNGIKILISKQFVPAGTANPGGGPYGAGEMAAHDKWRTIQLISRVDLSSLPAPVLISNYAFVHLDLPPLLLGVFGNFDSSAVADWSLTPVKHTTATAKATVTVHGEIGHVMLDGFRGLAGANIYRQFFTHPPTAADIAALGLIPTVIQPAIAVAIIKSLSTSLEESKDIGGETISTASATQHRFGRIELPAALTGYFIRNPINPYTPASPFYQFSPANLAGQTNPDNMLLIGQGGGAAYSKINLIIPMSKVSGATQEGVITAGDVLTTEVRSDDWKFGIWVLEAIQAIVPAGAYSLPTAYSFGPP
jgi:hypothetical protein